MNYFIATTMTALLAVPQAIYPTQAFSIGGVPQDADRPLTQQIWIPDVLARIAECESHNAHFDGGGNILRGGYNKHDIGKYQINDLYWGAFAKELGLDIYSEYGNEALALAIYEKYGASPWNWSKKCWDK